VGSDVFGVGDRDVGVDLIRRETRFDETGAGNEFGLEPTPFRQTNADTVRSLIESRRCMHVADHASRSAHESNSTAQRSMAWPDDLDACIAAPASHHVLFENDAVRVLEVIIEPGTREPLHTHRTPSVMIVDRPARIRYYHRGRAHL
jgi:hypothetical protein